jgi:hypothetical protein
LVLDLARNRGNRDMTDAALEDRAARNQALFREQNERIEGSNAAHSWVNPPFADWMCECAVETCSVAVRMTVAEYEKVRAEPTYFLVAPGNEHVVADVERVVFEHERYWVVEKLGLAAEVSERFDPRSSQPSD